VGIDRWRRVVLEGNFERIGMVAGCWADRKGKIRMGNLRIEDTSIGWSRSRMCCGERLRVVGWRIVVGAVVAGVDEREIESGSVDELVGSSAVASDLGSGGVVAAGFASPAVELCPHSS